MRKYRAKPVDVDAVEILEATGPHPGGEYACRCADGVVRRASRTMTARMVPAPGDYWVVQEDGYEYLNPKAVFERKYGLLVGAREVAGPRVGPGLGDADCG